MTALGTCYGETIFLSGNLEADESRLNTLQLGDSLNKVRISSEGSVIKYNYIFDIPVSGFATTSSSDTYTLTITAGVEFSIGEYFTLYITKTDGSTSVGGIEMGNLNGLVQQTTSASNGTAATVTIQGSGFMPVISNATPESATAITGRMLLERITYFDLSKTSPSFEYSSSAATIGWTNS